ARRGNPTLFTFYYSGHARATALALGREELSLAELRAELARLPATVTIAILDACQTGAISQIKGAAPAADFSFNSTQELNAAGLAIMASSTGSELSQESERLRSSYFTHHLLVGLRGAADSDGDGRITLAEAYRYAYHRTLAATAGTAVGRQHATLENDLRGKGELVLTYPARASAHLQVPAALSAEIVLQRQPGGAVVAELSKAAGERVRLGLAPGRYVALVRRGRAGYRCDLALAAGAAPELQLERCRAVPLEEAEAKSPAPALTRWGVELGAGAMWSRSDGYNHRLGDFGFSGDDFLVTSLNVTAAGTFRLTRHLSVLMRFDTLEQRRYRRDVTDLPGQTFTWSSYGLGVFLRAGLPLVRGKLTPYAQAGVGLTLGFTKYRDDSGTPSTRETYVGYELAVAGGLECMPWKHLGAFFQLGYTMAPTVKNLLGDWHDSGGPWIAIGVRSAW
ncbi:MAG: hypothetical protein HY906_12895, partial [Deltaproteobacteria bacterium]|nr:hypothetical protein [Deltaproteobacteria bacterium]